MRPKVIIVTGASHSGKSSLVRQHLKNHKNVALLNDQSDDPFPSNFRRVKWSEVKDLRDTAVVVEDVLSVSEKDFKSLQWLCNYAAHHLNCSPIWILSHSILRTNVVALINYATNLFFTLSPTSVTSLAAALTHLKFERSERERMQREFSAAAKGGGFGYYELDLETGHFARGDRQEKKETLSCVPAIDHCRFLEHLKNPKKAALLFDIIYSKLPDSCKIGENFELELKSKKTGEKCRANFVDYLDHLTDRTKCPTSTIKSLHTFVCGLVLLPECLVDNERLKRKARLSR
jgi:hypothetical protein